MNARKKETAVCGFMVKMADDTGRVDALYCKTLEPAWLYE